MGKANYTFIYNYWNDMGTFYFNGYAIEYEWNGYQVPNELLDDKIFQNFFNITCSNKVCLHGCKFKTKDCDIFLKEIEFSGYKFDLFQFININNEATEKIINKWQNRGSYEK